MLAPESSVDEQVQSILLQVVERLNGSVPSKRTQARELREAQVGVKRRQRAGTLSPLDAELTVDSVGAAADWARYDREEFADYFGEVATHGKLSKASTADLLARAREGLTYRVQDKSIDPFPVFKELRHAVAFALLRLSTTGSQGLKLIRCKHCERLALTVQGRPGRPRSEFCSPAHGNAYAQAQARRRARAAKHK